MSNNDILSINDARIIFRNFRGEASKYNREGDRNFAVVINDERYANELISMGWNVKIRPPREEGDDPFIFLPVKVKYSQMYSQYDPSVYLVSGSNFTRLDKDTIDILDNIDIETVDLDIRPYDWEFNGNSGRTAYLRGAKVVQRLDRFAEEFMGRKEDKDDIDF